ncbi:PspC domain-containing protein [Isoptericola variabilis]|uniref:PspC domain protein n=1 Tax=Isoptericola variabilis (strain 225) TaxID=743718 RepID=F6FWV9_ISOV2|nr:PspC domain-containing protein [Isoptericola variabilis]AEG43531.1 PspC domain protein [Isoptericola variabilis 225]TWH32102.1 phage shock protein C (PspC) family protein [Isoptericola variabilis J7]
MSTDDTSRPGAAGHEPGSAPPVGGVPPAAGTQPPRTGFFDSIRRVGVQRSEDRWVGGVAGGVAERFGVDPLLVRGLLILSFFLTGAGFVVYALAWALLPERTDGRIHLQEATRGQFDVALLGAALTLVVGFAWSDGPWSWWGGFFSWVEALLWIAVWVGVVVLIVKLVRDRRARTTTVPPPAPFTPAPPAPYATAAVPPAAPVPPTAPLPPPPPPRPRVPGAGAGTVGVVTGLALLAGALLLIAERVGDLDLPFWGAAWLGAAIAVVGAGIVVSGLRGRRGGGLTALAIVGILVGLALWPIAGYGGPAPVWQAPEDASVVSGGTVVLDTADKAASGVHVQFGDVTVDLTDLDLSEVTPGEPVVVPVSMAAGATRIVVPADAAVEAQVRMLAGNVTWRVDGDYRTAAGVTTAATTFTSAEVDELGGAQLLLEVDGSAGDITIRENR